MTERAYYAAESPAVAGAEKPNAGGIVRQPTT